MRDPDSTTHAETPSESAKRPQPGAEAASIRRNTVFALLVQITSGLFTTALTLYLLRALGPDGYGVFTLALTVGAITGLIADFGIPHSVARFLAESRDDHGAVASLLGDAFRLKLVSGALVTGGLFAAAGPIAAAYDEPGLTWPIRGIALSLFASSVLTLYTTAFIALGRIAVNLRVIFFESLVETAASIALVALGAGATGAAFGRAVGYFFGAVAAVVLVARLYGRSAVRPLTRGSGRSIEIARYAAPLLVTNSAYTLYAQVDILIIGALLGATEVGLFAAPLRLAVPLRYLGQSLAHSVAPRQARGVGDARGVQAFQRSLRWLIIYQAALLAPLVVWADPIVRLLFGPDYGDSADVLRVLALYMFIDGPSPLISTTVNYLGQAARRIPIVVVALAVNVAIDFALIPQIGVVGAAIGTTVAYWLYVPAHLRICRRELGPELRPPATTLTRALAAAALMGSVLFAVGTESLSPEEWLLGGAGAVLAYCSALVLTGEISRSEIRHGRRVVTANISRLAPFWLR
jgi:O-antigen/teichoic acid export membrane protein